MQRTPQSFFMRVNRKKLAVSLSLLMATSVATALPLSAQVLQQEVSRLDITSGHLSAALRQLEASTGIRLAYDEAALRKVRVAKTSYRTRTVEDILHDLLQSSSLKYEERSKTILIFDSADESVEYKNQLADKITITGKVTDKNGPLPGASVLVKGTSQGTSTDVKGEFRISTDTRSELTLVVSMLGYKTQEITIGTERNFNIVMEESTVSLNQLVVIGYGTQKRSTVSGAVADVQLDKIGSRSLNDLAEALQGKAPGVIVQNQGGDPTSVPKVYIRGLGGINGEGPLYVVDGAIYTGGPINPNDIESINVLKDASAAIYGARASGGVVLITTKKGKQGATTVTADVKLGFQQAAKLLKTLNAKEFADVMNQAADAAGKPRQDAFDPAKYPDGQITRTNWLDEIFRTGKIQDYNINVNGGNDKSRYYMALGYRKGDGILLNTYSERFSFRMNSDIQVKPWLKIGENMSYTYTNGNGANTTSPYAGAIFAALGYPRNITPYQPDGSYSGMPEGISKAYSDLANPVALLQRVDLKNPVNNININPYIEVKPIKDLLFRSNFVITKSFTDTKNFTPRFPEIGKPNLSNELSYRTSNYSEYLTEQTLTYNHNFNGHNVTALAGYTYQQSVGDFLTVIASGFEDERMEYRYLMNGSIFNNPVPSSGKDKWALESYLGRVSYDYKGRYLLSVLGRRDGTSRVGKANRYANYYAVTGGWVLTEEPWLRNNGWLYYAKIRGSYGLLGNLGSLPANAININMRRTQSYMGKDPQTITGYAEDAISNPNIKWAQSRQVNIGADLGFFENRLNVIADYFVKTTEDMLFQTSPTATQGVSNGAWKNAGTFRDRGIELGVNYNSAANKAFQYGVGVTLTKINNKLLSLTESVSSINYPGVNVRSTLAPIYSQVGSPLYSYYVIRTNGIFKTQEEVDNYKNAAGQKIQPKAKPGDIRFVDKSGNGSIGNEDREIVGSPYPGFTYGFSFNASYKGFDLNIAAQGVQGNKLFNALKYTNLNTSVGANFNLLRDILNAWSPSNPNSNIPRITADDSNNNYGNASDWYIEDGSYLRIKNVTLGYTLPVSILKHAGIKGLRVYVTGGNLLTFTKYKGFDPEVGMDEFGIDKGRYPQARSVLFGLNVNF